MLKTLGRTTWEEIEIGEVFALDGRAWIIYEKHGKNSARVLSSTIPEWNEEGNVYIGSWNWSENIYDFYKLPLSVQRLWRQDT